MFLEQWGASPDEITGGVVGDELVPHATLVATRAITLAERPERVFPWLRQMGFGRAGWYSYDWLDNLGRRSARVVRPDWQGVGVGDRVPAGPIDFVAAVVDPPRAFVLQLPPAHGRRRRVSFTLAYELRPDGDRTRLVSRMRARLDVPAGRLVERWLLGPGDGIMVRRQLLNLRARTG
jgi:hypothetical protein